MAEHNPLEDIIKRLIHAGKSRVPFSSRDSFPLSSFQKADALGVPVEAVFDLERQLALSQPQSPSAERSPLNPLLGIGQQALQARPEQQPLPPQAQFRPETMGTSSGVGTRKVTGTSRPATRAIQPAQGALQNLLNAIQRPLPVSPIAAANPLAIGPTQSVAAARRDFPPAVAERLLRFLQRDVLKPIKEKALGRDEASFLRAIAEGRRKKKGASVTTAQTYYEIIDGKKYQFSPDKTVREVVNENLQV